MSSFVAPRKAANSSFVALRKAAKSSFVALRRAANSSFVAPRRSAKSSFVALRRAAKSSFVARLAKSIVSCRQLASDRLGKGLRNPLGLRGAQIRLVAQGLGGFEGVEGDRVHSSFPGRGDYSLNALEARAG